MDSDESTSDTVVAVSSCRVPSTPDALLRFEKALQQLSNGLADDVVNVGRLSGCGYDRTCGCTCAQ